MKPQCRTLVSKDAKNTNQGDLVRRMQEAAGSRPMYESSQPCMAPPLGMGAPVYGMVPLGWMPHGAVNYMNPYSQPPMPVYPTGYGAFINEPHQRPFNDYGYPLMPPPTHSRPYWPPSHF